MISRKKNKVDRIILRMLNLSINLQKPTSNKKNNAVIATVIINYHYFTGPCKTPFSKHVSGTEAGN